VLPFNNYGRDEATGRLADCITEDTITDLARFRTLDVIARNSTEVYKGKPVDVRQVGKDLNVRYVLEGSVQRQGDRVRVTAQLIDAVSGAHVWSERWDRPAGDVFAVQTELAEAAADKIGGYYSGSLVGAGQEAAKRKRPQDLTAYDLYLLGMEAKHRGTREGMEEGAALLRRSLAIDPTFARAWTGMFWALYGLSGMVDETPEARKEREDAARRAVELDPEDAEARVALATVYGDAEDLGHAEAEFDKALRLSPNSADLLAIYADWAYHFGKPEAGVEAAERAMRLNPNTPQWAFGNFSRAYFSAGRYEEALRMLERVPRETYKRNDLVYRAAALGGLGRADEARAAVAETLARFPRVTVEWGAWWFGLHETEYRRLVETMRAAGFPVCAARDVIQSTPEMKRLPECVTS
jgi:TolB-like protein